MGEAAKTTVVEIEVGTDLYEKELVLRDEILRKPIGLKLPERMEDESACRHFGYVEDGELLGCLIVVPRGPETVQIRQMAVRTDQQGRGLGRLLMEAAEVEVRKSGIRRIYLNARATAIDFYGKLGYRGIGERFIEVGIPHLRMEKSC